MKPSKYRLLNYLILISILSIVPVDAITISQDVKSINHGNGYFTSDNDQYNFTGARNVYTYVNTTSSIFLIEPLGYSIGDSGVFRKINPVGHTMIDAIVHNGYLYYSTTAGLFREKERSTTNVQDSDDIYNGDTNPTGQIIQISSSSILGKLRGDGNYIYFIDGSTGHIKRVDITNNVVQTVRAATPGVLSFDIYNSVIYEAVINSTLVGGAWFNESLDVYKDGTKWIYDQYQVTYRHNTCGRLLDFDFQVITTNVFYVVWSDLGHDAGGGCVAIISQGTEGYFYNGSTFSGMGYPSYTNVGTNYNMFNVGTKEAQALARVRPNIEVLNVEEADLESETQPYELTYDSANIVSNYDTYYNNSDFDISYVMRISGLSSTERTQIFDTYYWKIELVDPSGVKIGEYSTISFTCSGIISFTCSSSGRVLFQPISSFWDNGTWTARLYEINATSQNKGLLDDDTYIVLDQSGNISIAPPIDTDRSATERTNDLLKSNLFWAFVLVITAFGMGLGFGLPGGIVGAAVGVIFTFLMGLLPLWALMLFAFVIIIAFVLIMVKVVS